MGASALALAGLLHALPATAVEFGEGGFRGSLDTTISHGMTFRVEEPDGADGEEGTLNGDVNGNDGNLNYKRGLVSNTSKFTTDLELGFGDFGAFVRATGFIDYENRDGERERTRLSDEAKERVGGNVDVLDAYVSAGFDAGGAAIDLRLGRHVLNWGESTFIPNGISVVNPIDVSKLRLPGSELREALLPVGMASASVSLTDALSVAGFYQFEWEETHIDPVGSYFSSTDYAGPGAREAVISDIEGNRDDGFGFGGPLTGAINADLAGYTVLHPATGTPIPLPQPAQLEFDPDFASVQRGPDRAPDDQGQWGVALRYLVEELNQTEFGLYFVNYHSKLPTVGAVTASPEALQAGSAAAGAVGAPGSATIGALVQQVSAEVGRAVQAGRIPPAQAQAAVAAGVADAIGGIAAAMAIDRYANGGTYFLEYAENLQLFGLSFNSVLGRSGWALQGEYSMRPNAPLQRAERKVIEDGLRPIIEVLTLGSTAPERVPAYFASYQPRPVQGYIERRVSQVQATATRVFGPTLGADSFAFVMEAALMHVHDMPDKQAFPLESPAGGVRATGDADADATSWGYRLAARLDYSNAIGAVNLYPYAQFLHDVSGNSPAPSGPFVEGRTALTVGLKADYLSNWQADLGYTRYAGDGTELADRDFVSLSFKYSF